MVGITHLFVNKNQKTKKIVKIVAFQGNPGKNRGDGVLNSNHRGTGQGKTNVDLGERVPWVPRRFPKMEFKVCTKTTLATMWMANAQTLRFFFKQKR